MRLAWEIPKRTPTGMDYVSMLVWEGTMVAVSLRSMYEYIRYKEAIHT
jgi:hypothetical protein